MTRYREHSHELRLKRAEYHVRSLEDKVAGWLHTRPYSITVEIEDDIGEKVVKLKGLEHPPDELGLIAGDCLHNLRSALDNLAFELAVAYTGEALSKSIAGDSGFPIFRDNNPQSAKKLKRMIRGVHPSAQEIIEGLQPYHSGMAYWSKPLWILRELSNSDKHRLPYLTLLLPTGGLFSVGDLVPDGECYGKRAILVFGPIEGSAEIARYPVAANFETKVDVDLTHALGVGFRDGSPAPNLMAVNEILRLILNHMNEMVVSPLRPFLRRIQVDPLDSIQ